MKPILEIHSVSKKFRLNHESKPYLSLRESLTGIFRKRGSTTEDFYALKDVSFTVNAGESVGIIGRNGAGKSTLLKILSKITPPSAGKIVVRGRIASLLEVGTGFHPELTGRENIYLNGSILGMKRKEIEAKFDEIVDFSGTEQFLDTPLKHFSSGMQVRLAFAVAAFLDPEILIVDEVLAVGDAEFQKKCLGRMNEVARSGRTVIFVSHNMGAIEEFCSRGILLEKGEMTFAGKVNEAVNHYLQNSINNLGVADLQLNKKKSFCFISELSMQNKSGNLQSTFDIQEEVNLCLKYTLLENTSGFDVSIIVARFGVDIFFTMDTDQLSFDKRENGNYTVTLKIPPKFLKEGVYSASIYFRNALNGSHYNAYKEIVFFEILGNSVNTSNKGYYKDRQGYVVFPGEWLVRKE